MLWKLLGRGGKERVLQGTVNPKNYKNLEFKHSWNNLVRMYDLRMWYVQNSPHDTKNLQYVRELEILHNELNYQNLRSMVTRVTMFVALFYLFYAFYDMPQNLDWQDYHEPKHDNAVYGELIDGGEEGGDD